MTLQVLIAGCGDVGNALGRRLIAEGHAVAGIRRDVSKLADGIRPVRADLESGEGFGALPDAVDVVVYAAAANERTPEGYRRAYVEGLTRVAEHTRATTWLFTSSTAVYGQADGEWVDEDAETHPARFNGQVMLEAERFVAGLGSRAAAVRLGGIYGPGRRQLVGRVLAGKPCVETPPRYTNRIHRDDAAGVLAHLLTLDELAPTWLAVDNEPAASHVVQDWLAERLGVAPPPRVTPEALPGPGSKRCSNARLLSSGYRFAYPSWREGYAALLAEEPQA